MDLNAVDELLSRSRAAICPLFRPVRDRIEQFASGVLVRIGEARFLLTAAHATDEQEILVPGAHGIEELSGHYSFTRIPESGGRTSDRYDIAFVRIEDGLAAEVHPQLTFLDAEECDLADRMRLGEAYSVIGFPSRRSASTATVAETSLLTLTGSGVSPQTYEKLEFSRLDHVVLQFRRRKAIDSVSGFRTPPCLPEGMSGGGIFAWSKRLPDLRKLEAPKLVGVVHEYHDTRGLFVGTRLSCYLRFIRLQYPDLPIRRASPDDRLGNRPSTIDSR